MKKLIFLCIITLFLTSPNISFAQCEPDTVHCKDTLLPGEICPLILPDGVVNESYEQVFTVIPPNKAQIQSGIADIVKIVIDTVGNLPPGLNYVTNKDTFYVDTAYCVLLSGIPATSGVYDLYIRIIPYIYSIAFGIFQGPAVVDDTSLTITIHEQSGIEDFSGTDFAIIGPTPNPFRNSTRIGFYIQKQDYVELSIYNLLGQQVYHELNYFSSGSNYFNFKGLNLQPGTYLYRVSNSNKSFTRKLIRLE